MVVFTADLLKSWIALSVELMGQVRSEIDQLNVFPVPDGDTGTNLYLTIEAVFVALEEHPESSAAEVATQIAESALLGARGNSGVITSQLLRGFTDTVVDEPGSAAAGVIADGLRNGAESAYSAVAVPREGTILSVARAAAQGAEYALAEEGADAVEVISAALTAAEEALARTPEQLPQLREAGVVDAGGRGLVVLIDAMRRALTGQSAGDGPRPAVAMVPHRPAPGYDGPEYEVMYLLEAPDSEVGALRTALDHLGDSVVVVGGRGTWNVHVHTDDVGAAIERGVEIGRPFRIRVTRLIDAEALRDAGRGPRVGRAIVVVAHGDAMAGFLQEQGAQVVRAPERGRPSTAELLDGIRLTGAEEVVLLPSDKDTTPVAEATAAAARDAGVRASVVPTKSIVQSLAALAVHDPEARLDDDLVAMGRAAGATRYAGVTVAARDGMTSAGICKVGDVLGLVDGDIVHVGTDVGSVASALLERLISGGTELVTIVTGEQADAEQTSALTQAALAGRSYLDVEVLEGGQPNWPFIMGAE